MYGPVMILLVDSRELGRPMRAVGFPHDSASIDVPTTEFISAARSFFDYYEAREYLDHYKRGGLRATGLGYWKAVIVSAFNENATPIVIQEAVSPA